MTTVTRQEPKTFAEAAATLAQASSAGLSVRFHGSGTKLAWGRPAPAADIELHTTGLNTIVEHNPGDLTAVLEAGVPLAVAQDTFAAAGQMLALDPPLGDDATATIGGIVATGDSGPLRHRYGAPRDLVIGATVALGDGTIAQSGGKVIKNVAGYDLAKLFAGSFGTLGLILSVSVRLHTLHASTTALGACPDPERLGAAAVALAAAPLELEALEVAWRAGRGGILMRCAGPEHARRARRAARRLEELGLDGVEVTTDDESLWERQRAGQRSRDAALVKVAAAPTALAAVIRASQACDGTLVGRAALGTSYVSLAPEHVDELRRTLPAGAVSIVLDAPDELRGQQDPWGTLEAPVRDLMHSVKGRFDPTGVCNRGLFVDGI
ncbi:MAG: FAD-binding oxidoreductase [Solirubrobacteraceae bacterium]